MLKPGLVTIGEEYALSFHGALRLAIEESTDGDVAMTDGPRLSVVIAARDASATLGACLDAACSLAGRAGDHRGG